MNVAVQGVGLLLAVVAWALAVPALLFLLQVLVAGRAGARHPPPLADAARPTVAVLMPAHDEASGISAAIATVLPQLRAGDRLLVVADNCSDDTAGVARAAGAEVVERHDPLRRGKGYALDRGVRALAGRPPAIVVVMDADCVLEAGSLDRLAKRCEVTGRPLQALYLMRSPDGAGLKTRFSEFAWVVKNQVRPTGFLRLGLPCQLMGTGMAFPWAIVRDAPLATGHLVEDMQLGIDLACRGTPPLFCPEARVTSVFPISAAGRVSQRTRWEHGHLSVIIARAPGLLWRGVRRGRPDLVAMALDLGVPPLAWLALAVCAVAGASAILLLAGGSTVPFAVSIASTLAIALATLVAWRDFGSHILGLGELCRAPAYALGKVPIYASFLAKKQSDWIRARRDDE